MEGGFRLRAAPLAGPPTSSRKPFEPNTMSRHHPSDPLSILFVCLGNICRSPLAEGIFLHLLQSRGLEDAFEVDSAGTGAWHVGEPPDARARAVARKNGIELRGRARQVEPEDLDRFDLLLAMDGDNHRNLVSLADGREGRAEIRRLREFDPETDGDLDVPDPYYGGPEGFDRVFEMVHRSCDRLLDELVSEGGAPQAGPGR
jgi:protein-tyrosine phosphatase